MINQPSVSRRAGHGVLAVPACLTLALIVHAQDASPPLPAHNFDQTPAHSVVKINAQCGLHVRLEAGEHTLVLAGVTVPTGEQDRARLRQFLEHLLVGEEVYIRPESAVPDPKSPADSSDVCLFRAPDGLFVNLEVVRQGYAKVRTKPPCDHHELLRYYEQHARKAKKGVWAPPSRDRQKSAVSTSQSGTSRPTPDADEIAVYVTKTGEKYHREGCQHLRKSSRAITLKEAIEKGYEPCSRCKPPTLESP